MDRWAWRQGEHVSVIGATGSGKTVLQNALLGRRQYVLVVATKPTGVPDPSIRALKAEGYVVAVEVPQAAVLTPRVLLWPKFRTVDDQPAQRQAIHTALNVAFTQGGWCVAVDEVAYLCRELRLTKQILNIWQQGRSANLSLVAATQRPAFVPRDLYGAATHLFFGRMGDSYDRSRVQGMGGADSRVVQHAITGLERFQFLYVNTITGDMLVTRVDRDSSSG